MNYSEFQANTPYAGFGAIAAEAPAEARLTFIRKTYMHLMAAVYGLVALEFLYFQLPLDNWVPQLFAMRWGWFLLFGGYMAVSYIADSWARSNAAPSTQYLGLFTYVFAFSVILCPMLWIANHYATNIGGGLVVSPIAVAAVATLAIFGLLTAIVFLTKKDFSFLGPILGIASILIFGAIILGMFGLLNLGTGFAILLAVFASGAILYDTSNVLHHYRTEQYVAASLALFASVGILFWYILQIVISLSNRR